MLYMPPCAWHHFDVLLWGADHGSRRFTGKGNVMKIRWVFPSVVLAALAGWVLMNGTGCETAEGLEGVNVTPSHVTLPEATNTVTFTVVVTSNSTKQFTLPLTWSVTDPSLGTIVQSSGYTALYERTDKNGQNTVVVRDPYGSEGYAIVEQVANQYTLTITATPNPIPAGQTLSTIDVAGGEKPYEWWVMDSSLGNVVSGGDSERGVYESLQPGENVVHMRDANGVIGTITIQQL